MKKEPSVSYLIEISDWSFLYSLGITSQEDSPDPFSEYATIELRGSLLVPERPRAASGAVVLLWAEPYLNRGRSERRQAKPSGVGDIETFKGFKASVSMPLDMLPSLLASLAAGKSRHLVLNGQRLLQRRATVRQFSFYDSTSDEDLAELRGLWTAQK